MTLFPDFYVPSQVGTLFYPDMAHIAAAAEQIAPGKCEP